MKNTYIALLRGINVSGQKKILMAEFRELLSKNGFENVRTYIQSGNVVFESDSSNPNKLGTKIESVIAEHYGFEVPTLILMPDEIEKAVLENPFIKNNAINEEETYFTFLKEEPQPENITQFNEVSYPGETFELIGKVVYYHCSIGYGKAKFTNKMMEKKLGTRATTRNYKTTLKLINMTKN
ncbi:MAG: DUF1697 domain-containing protein [Salibacteraceae bacterium]